MPHWLKQIGSYRILTITLGNWLFLWLLLACLVGTFYLSVIREAAVPATSETLTAEVSRLWVELYDDETGGGRIYRVELKQADETFTCTVPSALIRLWLQLERGRQYEFEAMRTRSRCTINQVTGLGE